MTLRTGYDLAPPEHNAALTEVGRGTPMGELLRRYWHPIGLTGDATETPTLVKALGEELILFRDGEGRAGLVHPRCAHRGSSLYFGKVEPRGIRCCYHGWLFDVEGNCLEQPCEPNLGVGRLGTVRQPWYPVRERYGLIWTYMGPADRQPLLPRYRLLEELDPGEVLDTDDRSIGSGGPVIVDFNWFQHYENVLDPFHVVVLHATFSGTQFVPEMSALPECEFEPGERGVQLTSYRTLPDGRRLRRVSECVLPTLRIVPSPRLTPGRCSILGWVLPMDDTTFRIYSAGRVKEKGDLQKLRSTMNGKLWEALSEEEHQRFPGDYEAQKSQGDITWHNHEHLRSTDRGIVMLRRFMLRQAERVAGGHDPAGVSFEPGSEWVDSPAGNWFET